MRVMPPRWVLGLGLLLASSAPALAAPQPAAPRPAPVERTLEVDGLQRAYLIDVPQAWDRRTPAALLFVFHGAGSTSESMVRATGFGPWADAEPTLIVYPRARANLRRYDADGTPTQPSPDVKFVDALLARLKERFAIDPARVYATGFSNGAAFCYRLAADRSEVFAAIAPVAGYVPQSITTAPKRPVPTLAVHGSADGRVPSPFPLADLGVRDDLGSVARAMMESWRWARWNSRGRTSDPVQLFDAGRLTGMRMRFGDPATLAVVETLVLLHEGHTWSGGPGGPISREIWTFLRAHPLPPPAPAPARPAR